MRFGRFTRLIIKTCTPSAPPQSELNLWQGEKTTRAVVRKVAYAAAHQSYAKSSMMLSELAQLQISPADFDAEARGKDANDRWGQNSERWKGQLRHCQVGKIIDELTLERNRRRGGKRRRIAEEIRYLSNCRDRMDYARCKLQGWPIGSGAIEAICKYLVKERFCVTGAHCRREKMGNFLALRRAVFNDKWDDSWKRLAKAA